MAQSKKYNFNKNNKAQYNLYKNVTDEMINLYGIEVDFIKAEKITDKVNVFDEIQHLKINNDEIFSIYVYPDNLDAWNNSGTDIFSSFGIQNFDTINLFVSYKTLLDLLSEDEDFEDEDEFILTNYNKLAGSLILFENKKLLQINYIETEVEGFNNMFPTSRKKNVYQFKCVPYNANADDFSDPELDKPEFGFDMINQTLNLESSDANTNETKEKQENNSNIKNEKDKSIVIDRNSPFGDIG